MDKEAATSNPEAQVLVGPTRKLLLAEAALLEELGLQEEAPVSSTWLVVLIEVLLLAGVGFKMLSLHLDGEFDGFALVFTDFFRLFSADELEEDKNIVKTFHIDLSMVVHVTLIPQLYMLVLVTREKVTLVGQLVLVVLLLIFTVLTEVKGIIHAGREELTCQERATCLHRSFGVFLFVNILIFLSLILVRLVFHLRWKTWLLSFKVVGPLLAFLTSRKCREFQALCLLISLGATTLSALTRPSPIMSQPVVAAVLTDLLSCLLLLCGLLALLHLYSLSHDSHNHRSLATEGELETALHRLGEEHNEVLTKSLHRSTIKYSPFTRSCRPVTSRQYLGQN